MNKKAMDWKFLMGAVIFIFLLLVLLILARDKIVNPWKSTNTMCGPANLQGKCGCCFDEGFCPADLSREQYSHPDCPIDSMKCADFCKDSKGWASMKKQAKDSLGEGTCCMAALGS